MKKNTTSSPLVSTTMGTLLTKKGIRLGRKTFYLSLFIFSTAFLFACDDDEPYCYLDEYGEYVCEEGSQPVRKPSTVIAPGIK